MKEKKASSGRKSALILYLFLAVILLAAAVGYYGIATYYPLQYREEILQACEKYDLDAKLVCAVIATESRFNPSAESKKGAVGLMQLMPETGEWAAGKLKLKEYSEDSLTDPAVNIRLGAWYLNFLSDRYHGDRSLIAAAYNAGHGAVDSWLKDAAYSDGEGGLASIPFEETEKYVKKVDFAYEIYSTFYKIG